MCMEHRIDLSISAIKRTCRSLGVSYLRVWKRAIPRDDGMMRAPYRSKTMYHPTRMNIDRKRRRIRFHSVKGSYPPGYHSWAGKVQLKYIFRTMGEEEMQVAYIPVYSLRAVGLQRFWQANNEGQYVVLVSSRLTFKKPKRKALTLRTVISRATQQKEAMKCAWKNK